MDSDSSAEGSPSPRPNYTLSSDLEQELATLSTVPELAETTAAYDEIKEAQDLFFDACACFAETPDSDTKTEVLETSEYIVDAMRQSINLIQKVFGPEGRGQATFGLMIEEDAQLIEQFRKITGSRDFTFIDKDVLRQVLWEYDKQADTPEEYTEAVMVQFWKFFGDDLVEFAGKVQERYQQRLATLCTVTFRLLQDGEDDDEPAGHTFAFSIEPPIQPHNPLFMGEDVTFDFSNQIGTYGTIYVANPSEAFDNQEDLEQWLSDYLIDKFDAGLNPLGHVALRILWDNPGE